MSNYLDVIALIAYSICLFASGFCAGADFSKDENHERHD